MTGGKHSEDAADRYGRHAYAALFDGARSLDKVYISRHFEAHRYLGINEGYILLGHGCGTGRSAHRAVGK